MPMTACRSCGGLPGSVPYQATWLQMIRLTAFVEACHELVEWDGRKNPRAERDVNYYEILPYTTQSTLTNNRLCWAF
jgi:hypothetical protein